MLTSTSSLASGVIARAKTRLLVGLVVAVATTGSTQASTIMQTLEWGPGGDDYTSEERDFALFDLSLGTLNTVTLSATYGFISDIDVVNTGDGPSGRASTPSSGTVFTQSVPVFTSPLPPISLMLSRLTEGTTPLPNNPSLFNFVLNGGQLGYSLDPETATTARSDAANTTLPLFSTQDRQDLDTYSATETGASAAILLTTQTSVSLTNLGGYTLTNVAISPTATLTITYDYTAVAEPASWTLFTIGLSCLAVRRRWQG